MMPFEVVSIVPTIAFSKRRVLQPPANFPPADQIIQPVETSQGALRERILRDCFLRRYSSAISGFRSLCGREQHSFGSCAQLDLRFGTFRSAGSRFENSGLYPHIAEAPTLDRCCEGNVVAPGEYSKRFFFVKIRLYLGIFRPATALRIPARSVFEVLSGTNPVAVIKASISPLCPCPDSTMSTAPGASSPAACGTSAR